MAKNDDNTSFFQMEEGTSIHTEEKEIVATVVEVDSQAKDEVKQSVKAAPDSCVARWSIKHPLRGVKQRFRKWLDASKEKFHASYAKRNTVTNVILSLYLMVMLLLTGACLLFTLSAAFQDELMFTVIIVIIFAVHALCLYHLYQLVVLNRKEAVWKSLISMTLVTFPHTMMYIVFFTPDDGTGDIGLVAPTILTVLWMIPVAALFFFALSRKKYGASAKMLLDVPRDKSRKYINFRTLIYIILLCCVPAAVSLTISYSIKLIQYVHDYDPNYKSADDAEIGDYYYEDGTASSEFRKEKKCEGVVFSLELTEYEKEVGYKHGHIMALKDFETTSWCDDAIDIDFYPDYKWNNRNDALNDKNGLEYYYKMQNDRSGKLYSDEKFQIKREFIPVYNYIFKNEQYSSERGEWYVPTAGEWADVLKNLGCVKVDAMLKFDAVTASKNLEKYNINPKRWYWTITEQDTDNAWSIRIADGQFGSRTPKSNQAYIRPIAAF